MSFCLLIFLALLEVGWAPWRDAAYLHQPIRSVPATEPRFAVNKGFAWSAIAHPPHYSTRPLGGGRTEYLRPPTWGASLLLRVDRGPEESATQVRERRDSHVPSAIALDPPALGGTRIDSTVIPLCRSANAELLPTHILHTIGATASQQRHSAGVGGGCRRVAGEGAQFSPQLLLQQPIANLNSREE